MDTKRRTLVKAFVWQIMGLVTMSLIGWIVTGSVAQSSSIAVIGTICSFVTYIFHERVWSRVRWGRFETQAGQKKKLVDAYMADRAKLVSAGSENRA